MYPSWILQKKKKEKKISTIFLIFTNRIYYIFHSRVISKNFFLWLRYFLQMKLKLLRAKGIEGRSSDDRCFEVGRNGGVLRFAKDEITHMERSLRNNDYRLLVLAGSPSQARINLVLTRNFRFALSQ